MPNPDHSCQIAMEEQIEEILQVFSLSPEQVEIL